MNQNIWGLKGVGLQRQRRRAQLIRRMLHTNRSINILDVGCAEGYATSHMINDSRLIVGLETDSNNLSIAKTRVKGGEFVNGSVTNMPFRPGVFDTICILEVLEHLQRDQQLRGIAEGSRVLVDGGLLIISVPYKEEVIQTTCIHCKNPTPLYGHLHSLDEDKIATIMPGEFKLSKTYNLANLQMLSCSNIFNEMPLSLWLVMNSMLRHIRKGYWIIFQYYKLTDPRLSNKLILHPS